MDVIEYLSIFMCFVTVSIASQELWDAKIRAHKPKSLRTDRLRRVAMMSDDPDQMAYFKKYLLKPILKVREVDTDVNREVQKHIKDTMKSYKWTLTEDSFKHDTPHGIKSFNTIIATQNPSAPRKLVLACHHDSKVMTFEFIGATDSAVPCAMMLDLARHMNDVLWKKDHRKIQDVSLQFIFFDGEEAFERWTSTDSIYGARHLAKVLSEKNFEVEREVVVPEIKTIDVLILLDLIGTRDVTFRNWFPETEKLFQRLQKIEQKLNKAGLLELPVDTARSSSANTYFTGSLVGTSGIEDDHLPFIQQGVPVLHLISTPFPSVWHKQTDNESALDYKTINNLNKILRAFVAEYLHLSP